MFNPPKYVKQNTDIPVIPDLDEVREEDLTQQVAEAPSANVRVTTMADLDRDLESTLPFSQTESGIDLKLLTNVLCPASALKEDDNTWQFQQLFTEIKSELLSEKEEKVRGGGGRGRWGCCAMCDNVCV